jgi:hypothetical protein
MDTINEEIRSEIEQIASGKLGYQGSSFQCSHPPKGTTHATAVRAHAKDSGTNQPDNSRK